MTLTWRSKLIIWELDRDQVIEAISDGTLPRSASVESPWCRLEEPLILDSDRCGHVAIPAGFIYDQASLPRAVRWWMDPADNRIIRAACWHDFLSPWAKGSFPPGSPMAEQERPPTFQVGSQFVTLNPIGAAEELYEGMRTSGANWFDAATCSRMVKTFGPKW